jgi:shikimate kinase
MKTSIALIGFMGTGKTVVGRLLSVKTGKAFVELDKEIVKAAGQSIPDIFRLAGESHFRVLETEAVKKFAVRKNTVIACGGGIVLNDDNIFSLRQECVIVCLLADVADILKRVAGTKNTRPLLDVPDREKRVKELLEQRRPLYQRAADVSISTSGLDAPGVVGKILEALGKYESNDQKK